ncbi:MAG TPA: hypothetical protein DCG72_13890, partial [Gammaproteobacteria bacterium]|nr:hypothetical protein [Gammaproteobacteria bacterium]
MSRRPRWWAIGRILVLALILHGVFLGYPFVRLGQWLGLEGPVWLLLAALIFFSQLICRWPLRQVAHPAARFLKQILELFLALSPLVLVLVVSAEVGLYFELATPQRLAVGILSIVLVALPYGLYRGSRPIVQSLNLVDDRLKRELHLVQITDVHIGSRSPRFLKQVLRIVAQLQPDALCITGDFIDQTGVPPDALAPLATLGLPVFFVTGNHERYEDTEDIIVRLQSAGVRVLRNQSVRLRGDVMIHGVEDADSDTQLAQVLPTLTVKDTDLNLLLYHRPAGLEAAADAGMQLTLSGHTHNGQIMPFNLLVRRGVPRSEERRVGE